MKSIKSAIIATPFGPVRIATTQEFIKLIPVKEWYSYSDQAGFHRKTRNPYFGYETIFKQLSKASITATELVKDLPILSYPKSDLIEMIHSIVTASACEMGCPTHIVRLGRRFWMAANPEDFVIFYNHYGSALANLRPNKSVVWLVDK